MKYYLGHFPSSWRKSAKKFKIKASFSTLSEAEAAKRAAYDKFPAHLGDPPRYLVLNTDEVIASNQVMKANATENRKKTVAKRKAAREKAGLPPKKPTFILCPRCEAKSKKLFSEMGGLQTRVCQNGHKFAVDTFGGGMRYTQTAEQFFGDRHAQVVANTTVSKLLEGDVRGAEQVVEHAKIEALA